MQVTILEPKGLVWQGMARQAFLPTEEGEICVLDFHQSFLLKLRKGQIRTDNHSTEIKDGFAFMKSNDLKIFVET